MKKAGILSLVVIMFALFGMKPENRDYEDLYNRKLSGLDSSLHTLAGSISNRQQLSAIEVKAIKRQVAQARLQMKAMDMWLRYLEPVVYKKVNGPLPVEWENEVFEKYEHPYKREGKGLYLATTYLKEKIVLGDSLQALLTPTLAALNTYKADSITRQLDMPGQLLLCNRLYLLNLAALYTTGFECADDKQVIPELRYMMGSALEIYQAYNKSFPTMQVSGAYLSLYSKALVFVNRQSGAFEQFDHFTFIKDYVNPLFAINQQLLVQYHVPSASYNDYTLTNTATSIFSKQLYTAQNTKGVFSLVDDEQALEQVKAVGKMLFYDPLLSGNNERACASCHKPAQYFTDTTCATNLAFNGTGRLPRNTPSLIDVVYNHLLMLDGKHLNLHEQAVGVMTNNVEMAGTNNNILEKVLSCRDYKNTFKRLLKYTPEEKELTMDHIVSAITYYFSGFSNYYSAFDEAMNHNTDIRPDAVRGFNLFMGKAKCGTCHYVPQFSGVPPPFISSEFEVVGTPADTDYNRLSADRGRYAVNPSPETDGAFRTTTVRNAAHTMPYMHNGVFTTLHQVIDFYNAGGGAGKKLTVPNQTLSAEPLQLTTGEEYDLMAFIKSLSEDVPIDVPPAALPHSTTDSLNKRKVGGRY